MITKQSKAERTRGELLHAACGLFSEKWYETVSVSEICRAAGKSSGAFYNYFRSKEEIFLALLDIFLVIFEEQMGKISGRVLEERLQSFIELTIETGRANKQLVSVFREGQYRYPEKEKQLRAIYVKALTTVYGRVLDEAEYLYVSGSVRFISIRSLYHDKPYELNTLKELILHGLYRSEEFDPEKIFKAVEIEEKPESVKTRDRLIRSAYHLFGREGYDRVNVYDITRSSGVAVGTFYRHFKSKESILKELVEQIGHDMRFVISTHLDSSCNRLEQELRGVYLFIRHFERNPAFYTIIREAEFVIGDTVKEYYDRFEQGYLKKSFPADMDAATVSNVLIGIAHYLGIEDIFCENIADIEEIICRLGGFLRSGISR